MRRPDQRAAAVTMLGKTVRASRGPLLAKLASSKPPPLVPTKENVHLYTFPSQGEHCQGLLAEKAAHIQTAIIWEWAHWVCVEREISCNV